MNHTNTLRCLVLLVLAPMAARAAEPARWAEDHVDQLVPIYQHLHANPELSLHEVETARLVAKELQAAGAAVTTGIGGHGLVGVLENGGGKRLLIRTDLDALPIVEETGLPYASRVRAENPEGAGTVGVMHACGHDLHMTNLIGVARYLAENRDRWRGTILLVGQPAEERVLGAKAMLDDGLYERFGKPDFALALHVAAELPAGTIACRAGFSSAASDVVDIVVRGAGGHGARPHTTKDPIVQAAQLILALQTIVSREIDPVEPAVITVGAIHGGTKHNIIPDTCELKLTVRTYSEAVRDQIHKAIAQRAAGIAESMGAPPPEVNVTRQVGAVFNEPALVERLVPVFRREVGETRVIEVPPSMTSEDFGVFGRGGVPIFMFGLGTATAERLKLRDGSCSLHTARYQPEVRPALVAGIAAMSAAAMELLSP